MTAVQVNVWIIFRLFEAEWMDHVVDGIRNDGGIADIYHIIVGRPVGFIVQKREVSSFDVGEPAVEGDNQSAAVQIAAISVDGIACDGGFAHESPGSVVKIVLATDQADRA